MTFKAVVEKLAAQPKKVDALRQVPTALMKSAGLADSFKAFAASVYGSGAPHLKDSPLKSIGKDVTSNLLTAGAIAASAGLYEAIRAKLEGHPEAVKEHHKELGKATAKELLKTQAVLKLQDSHKKILADLMKDDEYISAAPKPVVTSSFATMVRFAPHLAADENAARSFLRSAVSSGVGPDYATLKTLAESEKAVQESGGGFLTR